MRYHLNAHENPRLIEVFHLVRTHLGGGGVGGSSLLYISIAYYMQKGGSGVQIACKLAYVLNGRPHSKNYLRIR